MKRSFASTNQVRQLLVDGQFEQAAAVCLEILADDPNNANALVLLAVCDEQCGDQQGAQDRLRKAIALDSQHAQARFELARLTLRIGDSDAADELLDQCIRINPNHAAARTLRARLAQSRGDRGAAISELKTALRADPNHVPALTSLAQFLLDDGDIEQANQYASEAVNLAPEQAITQRTLSRVLRAQGSLAFAEQCLINAIERSPADAELLIELAVLRQAMNRHEDALLALDQAAKGGAASQDVLASRALSLLRLGRMDEARDAYERLLVEKPARDLVLNLGDIYRQMGDSIALAVLSDQAEPIDRTAATWLRVLAAHLEGRSSQVSETVTELLAVEDAEIGVRVRLLQASEGAASQQPDAVTEALRPLLDEEGLSHQAGWEAARLARDVGSTELALDFVDLVLARSDQWGEEIKARTYAMRVDLLDRLGRFDDARAHFQSAAWQAPYLSDPAYLSGEEPLAPPDLAFFDGCDWSRDALATDPPRPVFVVGWPYSGYDLLIEALAQSAQVQARSAADWPERRHALGLPCLASEFQARDLDQIRLLRHRYRRGTDPSKVCLLEAGAVSALDLPHLARLFRDAWVIVPEAEPRYLELQWRLAAYRQVPTMLKVWRRDRAIIETLRDRLPLSFVFPALEAILTDAEKVLGDLSALLGLRYDKTMSSVGQRLAKRRGYREPRHWRHYWRS